MRVAQMVLAAVTKITPIEVDDLDETERFYVEVLGCEIGRRTSSSINFNFGGHQIVAHEVSHMPDMNNGSGVDGITLSEIKSLIGDSYHVLVCASVI